MKRFIALIVLMAGCRSTTPIVADPVYYSPTDTITVVRRVRWIGGVGEPEPIPYYYPMGGWTPNPAARERVIIIERPAKPTPARRRSGRN